MSGNEHRLGFGRFAALAVLATSFALFLTALSGIASIDPGASAAGPAGTLNPPPSAHEVKLDEQRRQESEQRDCPWRHKDAKRSDVTS